MATSCEVHPSSVADGDCDGCRRGFCVDCLVRPFGPAKPPLCMSCALHRAGVRHRGRRSRV